MTYEYQDWAAIQIAGSRQDLYLAYDSGLGKSKIALEVAQVRGVKRLYVFCPASAVPTWRREIGKWWPGRGDAFVLTSKTAHLLERPAWIAIVSYGLMSSVAAVVQDIGDKPAAEMTALDEAHWLKSTAARRTQAVLAKLRRKLGRVLLMSATPAPNHAGELYAALRSIRPDLIPSRITPAKPMKETEFKRLFVETRMAPINGRQVEIITGSKNTAELRDLVGAFFLRATKQEMLPQLPPLAFDLLPVEIKPLDALEFNQAIRGQLGGAISDTGLELLLSAADNPHASVYRRLGVAKAPAVAEWLRDWLDGCQRQMIVWAIHHDVIDIIHKLMRDFDPVVFDGRCSPAQKIDAETRFQDGKTRLFIGQIHAAGESLTLCTERNSASDAVFAESSFSPHANYQAASRIHRIGQNNGVLARLACAAGTYDQRIQSILARKTRDFADLFEKEKGKALVHQD